MVSKLLQVFYSSDFLPYKDSERTVHFPIGGGTFAGSQNTFRIRFYPKDLVGGNDYVATTTWVLVSKRPNGTIGYQLLSDIQTDSVLGEKYIQFDLSAYYTTFKGVLKLALRGYQGEVNFVEDEDTGVYSIEGTPIIGVTGTIDISINYSPMIFGDTLLPSDYDDIAAMFSNYLSLVEWKDNFIKRIVVVDNTLNVDLSDYDYGQIFYDKSNSLYYIYDEDEGDLIRAGNGTGILNDEGYVLNLTDYYLQTTPYSEMFELSGGNPFVYNHSGKYYLVAHYKNGVKHELFAKCLTDETYYGALLSATSYSNDDFEGLFNNQNLHRIATREWVGDNYYEKSETYTQAETDSAIASAISTLEQREFQKVNTTTYPTLNDFLASEGEEGYIYLYPIDTSDETNGFYQYIWENNAWLSLGTTVIDLSDYVQKTTSANKVYGTNELGAQTTYPVDDFYEGNVARRDTDGSITVPLTPTQNGHAASKKYVDDLCATKYSKTEVNELLEDKANVDGNYPTLTAGLADNLTPYSEDSGAEQDNPFISNGTGTNNNTEIVTVGDYGLLKEKQGNTLVVNQLARPLNSQYWGGYTNITEGVATFTATNQYGGIYETNRNTIVVGGHSYLLYGEIKLTTATTNVKLAFTYRNSEVEKSKATSSTTNWQNISFVFSVVNTYNDGYLQVFDNRSSGWDAVQVKNIILIDLTQMFNGNIPQDLLDNPNHFPWYYNGDLIYNTGTLVNANGVKLVSTGRNLWDEEWELGDYNASNGNTYPDSSRIRSKSTKPIRVIPNTTYYIKSPNDVAIYCYDKNQAYIRNFGNRHNTTFITPENCEYIKFAVVSAYGTTYNHDITISLYYTPEQGGEGYDKYYPYEEPYVVDTGSEVLKSAGSVKDYKEPNGTIHRLVGNRAYQSGDENDSSLLTDGTTTNYPLETPTTEQGTPFAENLPINDYGMLYWLDENDNLVGIPQGAKIFYPTNYKGFVDDMYSRVEGDSSAYALESEITDTALNARGYYKQVDVSSLITATSSNPLTINYKKAVKIGNLITLTISATNSSGNEVSANTGLFSFDSSLTPSRNLEFPAFRYGNASFFTLSQYGSMWCRSAIPNGNEIVISISYVI